MKDGQEGSEAMLRFCPLASGSSGNSTYIGSEQTHLLIDAGISGKKVMEALASLSLTGEMLSGIFVTHEHSDHIKGIGVLSRRFDLPVYATEGTWQAMEGCIGTIARKNKKIIYSGEKTVFADLILSPFAIPHDAAQPVGYTISDGEKKVSIATDIGHPSDSVKEGIADSDALLLEANYDVEMLRKGPYPYPLKQRILGDLGHMSNPTAGDLLAEMVTSRLRHVYLGHLSAENNTPQLAYHDVCERLYQRKIRPGRDFAVALANRHTPSSMICLE